MTERRPLVIINGEIRELPNGDTLPSAAGFLSVPNEIDDSDATYFYFGWNSVGDSWLIQRQVRATAITASVNSGYANLAAAWADRATLTYG